jgi:membrane-bound metal-dependent hydrolase YbcI (DUF457 family)
MDTVNSVSTRSASAEKPHIAVEPTLVDGTTPRRRKHPTRLLVIMAAVVIAAADGALHVVNATVASGAVDEPAHIATTVVILAALGWPLGRRFAVAAIIASVAIDLDHVPWYLGADFLSSGAQRPVTHSWLTLAAVGILACALKGRWRVIALGAELGLVGHLFRDMAEPGYHSGVALFWPLSDASMRVPYFVYALVICAALVATFVRTRSRGAPRRPAVLERRAPS